MLPEKKHKGIRIIYTAWFLFTVHIAVIAYINSTFLGSYLGEGMVGLLYIGGYTLAILGLYTLPKLAKKIGHKKNLYAAIILSLVALSCIILSEVVWVIALGFVLYLLASTLIFFEFDILLESVSSDTTTGQTRGLFLTIMNMAWLISPFISGLLLDITGTSYRAVYILSAFVMILVLIIVALTGQKETPHDSPIHGKTYLWETFAKMFRNDNIRRVFIASVTLSFFYAIMTIYTPIYVYSHIGFSWLEIGFMLTVMHIPFILLEYPIGRAADRKWGEKEMMIAGIIIIAVASFLFSIPTTANIILWTALFVLSRIGASLLEATTESYFFKQVNEHDDDIISVQRNAAPLAYILAPAVASIFLAFFDLRYLFILLAVVVMASLLVVYKLKDTK